MTISIEQAAFDLAVALVQSSVIGFERQWHNRLAGLRTNTLVTLGATSFVVFERLIPDRTSQSRVAAQFVPGIGFLGAGLIFRGGLSVHAGSYGTAAISCMITTRNLPSHSGPSLRQVRLNHWRCPRGART
jgi:uncharacterized membrane protein YhiD involved in acid resistance